MPVDILLFGQLKELFHQQKLQVTLPKEVVTVAELRQIIVDNLSHEQQTLASTLAAGKTFIALNQRVAQEADTLTAQDEIALFPPVTGG